MSISMYLEFSPQPATQHPTSRFDSSRLCSFLVTEMFMDLLERALEIAINPLKLWATDYMSAEEMMKARNLTEAEARTARAIAEQHNKAAWQPIDVFLEALTLLLARIRTADGGFPQHLLETLRDHGYAYPPDDNYFVQGQFAQELQYCQSEVVWAKHQGVQHVRIFII